MFIGINQILYRALHLRELYKFIIETRNRKVLLSLSSFAEPPSMLVIPDLDWCLHSLYSSSIPVATDLVSVICFSSTRNRKVKFIVETRNRKVLFPLSSFAESSPMLVIPGLDWCLQHLYSSTIPVATELVSVICFSSTSFRHIFVQRCASNNFLSYFATSIACCHMDPDNLHTCIVSSGHVHLAPCKYVQVIAESTSATILSFAWNTGIGICQHPFIESSVVNDISRMLENMYKNHV